MKYGLAAIAMVLVAGPAFADGRSDWSGYDWRPTEFGACLSEGGGKACHAHHAKWDWKRDQWVDIFYRDVPGGLEVSQQLTNNDRWDSDYVCVTVLFLDEEKRNVAAYHANVQIGPDSSETGQAVLALSDEQKARIAQVEIGTKQCRDGAGQDDEVFAAVRAAIAP